MVNDNLFENLIESQREYANQSPKKKFNMPGSHYGYLYLYR